MNITITKIIPEFFLKQKFTFYFKMYTESYTNNSQSKVIFKRTNPGTQDAWFYELLLRGINQDAVIGERLNI